MDIIRVKNLCYNYNSKGNVFSSFSLDMTEGSIFGLIGKNGAGKSTLIKILLGLYPVSPDTVFIFGKDICFHKNEILKKVGAFVETPTLYPNLTAYEYLRIKQLYGNLPKGNIDKYLAIVGLDKKLKTNELSLGMKQRLAIANALLNEPKLLILDEPTNGLDPHGIIDIRNLILELNQSMGISVFLSSHLLAEVEKIITDIAIIGSNKVHFNGKLNDLQNSQNMILKMSTNDNEKANLLVSSFLGVVPTQEVDSWVLYHLNHKEHVPNIIKLLTENNLDIYKIVADVNPLEDIFLDYTNQGI